MFSKIDKKILICLIVVLAVAVVLGVVAYKYLIGTAAEVKNSVGGAETESPSGQNNDATPQVQIQAEGDNGDGGFSVCLDKCGDGFCQKSDPYCENSMNCICPETKEECPQDCK